MTPQQTYRLITRAISVLCLVTVWGSLLYLPQDVLSTLHYWRELPQLSPLRPDQIYFLRYYIFRTSCLTIQVVALVWAALWFYQGSPRLYHFFFPEEK
jgi:hypothetical protein